MTETKIQTNGYKISEKLQQVVEAWKCYLDDRLHVKEYSLFYFGDDCVFADCILPDGNYGSFNITEKQVHYTGCECAYYENDVFASATWNDNCYIGKLFIK